MSEAFEPVVHPPITVQGSVIVPPRRSWQWGIAPHYIGLFLWVVFVDRIGRTTLPIGGLGWSMLGALAAGLLCNELLFKGPALWGHSADKSTMELAARVFGTVGSRGVSAVIGFAEVVWFAVSVGCATELTIDGLIACGFFDESMLRPLIVGRYTLMPMLFLVTSLFWSFAVALTATWLVRVIGALMNAYPIFPALVLGAGMLALLRFLPQFAPTGIDPLDGRAMPVGQGSLLAFLRVIQLVFGFFAMAGVMSADWGKGSETSRDVRLGGWVGVAFAPAIVAAIALMMVAAYQGKVAPRSFESEGPEPGVLRRPADGPMISDLSPAEPPTLLVRDAIRVGIGGRVGGGMLLVLGLGALAPGVYSSFKYAFRFREAFGGPPRIIWMLIATALAWPLMATGLTRHLETIFVIMGAVFAPMAGAYSALAAKDRRGWTGERRGINPAGAVGWLVGVPVGLLPLLGLGTSSKLEPSTLWAFVVGYALTRILAGIGWESRPNAVETGTAVVDEAAVGA